MSELSTPNQNRRRFMKAGCAGLSLAPVASLLFASRAEARGSRAVTGMSTEIPKVTPDDPQAIAVAYHEDVGAVDTGKYRVALGASCRNCQLYSGVPDSEWGPCAIFSYRVHPILNRNFVVSANGWCRSWGPRAG